MRVESRELTGRGSGPAAGVHAALLTVQLLFGTLPLAGQIAMKDMSPRGLAALRIGGAALVLGLLAGRRLLSVKAADLPHIALYAALGIVGNQVLFLEGLSRTTQINAAILITTIPILTLAFAVALRRERASVVRLAGIVVGLAGALALTRIERLDLSDRTVVGNVMVVVNASFWSLHLVLARPMLQRIDPLVVLAWMFLISAVVFLPFAASDAVDAIGAASTAAWLAAAWAVCGPTVASYLLNIWALRRAESTNVAVYVYLQPLVAGVLAWAVAGERLTVRTGVAAAAIFLGVAVVHRHRSRSALTCTNSQQPTANNR